jgi:hypothetical protein
LIEIFDKKSTLGEETLGKIEGYEIATTSINLHEIVYGVWADIVQCLKCYGSCSDNSPRFATFIVHYTSDLISRLSVNRREHPFYRHKMLILSQEKINYGNKTSCRVHKHPGVFSICPKVLN